MAAKRERGLEGGQGLILAAATLVLLGVTALASRDPLSAGTTAAIGQGGGSEVAYSPWGLVFVGTGAAVALVGFTAYLVNTRRRRAPEPHMLQARFRASLLARLTVLMVLLLVGAVLVAGGLAGARRQAKGYVLPGRAPALGVPVGAPRPPSPGRQSSFEVPWWVPLGVLAIALGGAVVLIARPTRRRPGSGSRAAPAATELGSAIASSLADLDADPDPRRAVIAAYRTMEESLAAAGIPRRPAEAPREYLVRVAAALEIDQRPLRTLTNLFERARFSVRRVDAALREQAIAALRALEEELA